MIKSIERFFFCKSSLGAAQSFECSIAVRPGWKYTTSLLSKQLSLNKTFQFEESPYAVAARISMIDNAQDSAGLPSQRFRLFGSQRQALSTEESVRQSKAPLMVSALSAAINQFIK
jgi:hypothetical protein